MDSSPQRAASEPSSPASGPVLAPASAAPVPRAALWAHRFSQLILVVFCSWVGMMLVALPWTRDWTDNRFLLHLPALRDFLARDFVRGMASGLGVIDIWIGVWQAFHYRDRP